MAFNQLEPIGDWVNDFRFARLSALIMNLSKAMWGGEKGREREWSTTEDFLPANLRRGHGGGTTRQQTVEEMKRVIYQVAGRGEDD